MRIVILTDDFTPRIDGVVTSTLHATDELRRRGHEVFIVAPKHGKHHDKDSRVIRTKSIATPLFPGTRVIRPNKSDLARIAKLKPDLIHSQTQFGAGIFAHLIAKQLRIPHVSTMHTKFAELTEHMRLAISLSAIVAPFAYRLWMKEQPDLRFYLPKLGNVQKMKRDAWRMIVWFLNHTTEVISPSEFSSEALKSSGLLPNISVVPNGIELEGRPAKYKAHKKLRVVLVGRLSPEKRTETILRAMALCTSSAKLVIVGDGPSERRLKKLAQSLGMSGRVSFTGRLSQPQVKAQLAEADVGALVSVNFDNQPMVVLEYLAAGLPILYCDPHLREGLSKENSLLSGASQYDLARSIDQLAANKERLSDMAERSIALADQFTVKAHVDGLQKVYKRALKQGWSE